MILEAIMSKKKIKEELVDPLEKLLQEAVEKTAEDILTEIETAYENVIQEFYNDYTPKNGGPIWYKRTGASFYGSNAYDTLINPSTLYLQGDTYITGIDVHSQFVENNPYGVNPYRADVNSPSWVFDRTFNEGIHGFTAAEVDIWSSKKHINRHKKKSRFRKPKNIPHQMRTPPKQLMDEKFKDISSQKHLDEIFNKNVTKLLKH